MSNPYDPGTDRPHPGPRFSPPSRPDPARDPLRRPGDADTGPAGPPRRLMGPFSDGERIGPHDPTSLFGIPADPGRGRSIPEGPPGFDRSGPGSTSDHPGPVSSRPRRGVAALVVAAVFAAGAGGVLVGRELALDAEGPLTGVSASFENAPDPGGQSIPVVDDGGAEPIAAVAEALAPAVVQLETRTGLGSGFIYDAEGLIMTAAHVVDGAETVSVRFADGSRLEGTVLGTDGSTDIAVVRIDTDRDLPVARLALDDLPQVGQTAIAIGSPFGLDQTVTAGIVSAVGRTSQTPEGFIPAIQTDAPINSGNSGGALADRHGRVIGVNDSIITGGQGAGNVGVGFAVPIDLAKVVADKIVAGESLAAGYLGVSGADAAGDRAGALVTTVEPGSPAASARIQVDDLVVAIDDRSVSSMVDLAARVRTAQPNDTVTLSIIRGGNEVTIDVTLGTAPNR